VLPRDIVCAAFALPFGDDGVERAALGGAPVAFRIWRPGPNPTDMGVHVFSEESAKTLMAEQAVRGNRYSIDADHMSLNQVAPPEARKAVGWHRLAVRPSADGPELWAVEVEWTDAVKAGLEKTIPEWRYFSPAYKTAKDGEIVSYLNTAITNNPATHHVTELATLQAASRTSMDYKEMAAAFFGKDEEKRKDAKACYSKMSEAERKAFKAAWKAAESDFGEEHKGGEAGEGKEEAKKASEAEDEKKKAEAKKASEAEEEKKKEEAKRAASAAASGDATAALAARVQALEAEKASRLESEERASLLAKRPDLAPEVATWLASESLAVVRKAIETLPKGPTKPGLATIAAASFAVAARGAAAEAQSELPIDMQTHIASRMGVATPNPGIKRSGRVLELGFMTPNEAKTFLANKTAAAAKGA
jgi:phage I-like protein